MPLVEALGVVALWINRQTCATRFETHMQAWCDHPGFTFAASNYKPTRKQPANGDESPKPNVQVLFHSLGTGRGNVGVKSRDWHIRWLEVSWFSSGWVLRDNLVLLRSESLFVGQPVRLDKMHGALFQHLVVARTGDTRGPRRQPDSTSRWGWWARGLIGGRVIVG